MLYNSIIKRSFDFMISLIMLFLLFPLIIIIASVLAITLKGNPFFVQQRPGRFEKIFALIKFKSMTSETDSQGNLLADEHRLTKMGVFIRKTSLDEIPQLINVLKGDMSFVGPRPLLIRYLPYYSVEEKMRHQVRPGITGLAQVSGRNFLGWDKRLSKDVYYVQNQSFILDFSILLKTVKNVITSKDVSVNAFAVMGYLDEERKKVSKIKL